MTRILASAALSAHAFARSRTIDALVLKRSIHISFGRLQPIRAIYSPSRVMPGFRGTPAGMMTTSAPLSASARPDAPGWWPVTLLLVLMWLISAATPAYISIFRSSFSCTGQHTRATLDIVQRQLRHPRVELHQQRQGLANATGGTKHGDLRELDNELTLVYRLNETPRYVGLSACGTRGICSYIAGRG